MSRREFSKIEKQILTENYNITRSDLSHYKHEQDKYISEKKLKIMNMFNSGELIESKDFIPFNPTKKIESKYVLIIKGIKQ